MQTSRLIALAADLADGSEIASDILSGLTALPAAYTQDIQRLRSQIDRQQLLVQSLKAELASQLTPEDEQEIDRRVAEWSKGLTFDAATYTSLVHQYGEDQLKSYLAAIRLSICSALCNYCTASKRQPLTIWRRVVAQNGEL